MMRKLSANCKEKGMGYGAGDRARELFVLASPNIVKRYTTWKHCVYKTHLSVAPLRREGNGFGPLEIDKGQPTWFNSREKPYATRNLVTHAAREGLLLE